ncbi:organic cation transporter protein-like [Gigantopelta aegis]|uniref:organic cation transporter protein-like n=1 Tax=Gigantopelta aegis TaxID=1735272 RepID=UPI001B88D7C7|nr:organic cation transporter protein-like [Gigantopelta aegis]
MGFDEFLDYVGQFGKYQRVRYFLLCLFSVVAAWHSLNMVFVGAKPENHCRFPDVSNFTPRSLTVQDLATIFFIPPGEECRMYNISQTLEIWNAAGNNITSMVILGVNRSIVKCPLGSTFSTEKYKSTIVSEFELVCDRKFWVKTSKSVYFAGRLLGAAVFGHLSDSFGRRPMFFVAIVLLVVSGGVTAASQNIFMFLPLYFLQGAAQTGAFLIAFTLSTELVGPNYRVVTGFVIQIFYSIGYMSLAAIAYFLQEWRYLEAAITAPCVLFVIYWWFLPESVRWLLSQNRDKEAEKIIEDVAKANKVTLSPDIIESLKKSQSDQLTRKYTFMDFIRHWRILKLSLNIWFNWLVNALVYYGLSLNTENLGGNPYVNFCIAGAVEIPAYLVCIFLLNTVGRRIPLVAAMCIGGVACIVSGNLPTEGNRMQITSIVLAMVGKFCITGSYAIIYLMAAELFPTVVRNTGMGISSMSARIGGILAPLFIDLKSVAQPLPIILFGGFAVASGLLALLLPETKGRPLPERLEDVQETRWPWAHNKLEVRDGSQSIVELSDL